MIEKTNEVSLDEISRLCEVCDLRPSQARVLLSAIKKVPDQRISEDEARALVQDIAATGELIERRAEVISILLSI